MLLPAAQLDTACLLVLTSLTYSLAAWLPLAYNHGLLTKVEESVEDRIVGGYDTTIEEFPFQLALEGGHKHICGGSILNQNWALTAAHCVYDQPVRWMSFRAGSTLREKGGTLHPVKYYIYHEKYQKSTLDYDVAVVYVKVPFIFSAKSMPVLLPFQRIVGGEDAVVTGWGYLETQILSKPRTLVAADLKVWSWEECNRAYSGRVTHRMMCAGDEKKDICNGDSGGPLVLGYRQQVGIVSWAYKCGDGMPSVYTNVSAVTPWIRKTTDLEEPLYFID